MKILLLLLFAAVLAGGCSDKSENSIASPTRMLLGTWRDSKDTNRWMQFLPDGRVVAQDEQKDVHLGTYTVITASNVVLLVEKTNTATVPFYFPSTSEVILTFPGETVLLRRENSN